MPNNNIDPITTTQWNVGFDFGLWNNRLTFQGDWYYKQVDNRKIPFLGFVVPDGPHLAFLEKLYSLFLGHLFVTYRLMLYDMNNNIFRFLERLLKCINITYDP